MASRPARPPARPPPECRAAGESGDLPPRGGRPTDRGTPGRSPRPPQAALDAPDVPTLARDLAERLAILHDPLSRGVERSTSWMTRGGPGCSKPRSWATPSTRRLTTGR